MEASVNPAYQLSCGLNNGGNFLPVSAFSAYNLLRNCNYLLNSGTTQNNSLSSSSVINAQEKILPPPPIRSLAPEVITQIAPQTEQFSRLDLIATSSADAAQLSKKTIFSPAALLNLSHSVDNLLENSSPNPIRRPALLLSPSFCGSTFRKHRGEKKPIPDEQKDDKYFERRRRNNQAAKKSRDARKMREDQVALRATILEHENAILRAQILTLREESSSLRQMLLQRKAFEMQGRDPQICLPSNTL